MLKNETGCGFILIRGLIMAAGKYVYVYTKRFETYSRGKRKAGTEVQSDYVNFKDPDVIRRWLKRGFIRKVYVKEHSR